MSISSTIEKKLSLDYRGSQPLSSSTLASPIGESFLLEKGTFRDFEIDLNRKESLDDILAQFTRGSGSNNTAFLHSVVPVGFTNKMQMLLH